MARTATATNGALWVWDDNDNPGAGPKGTDVQEGGTGLNANWETLDRLFTEHNTDGTHKADKITGANLKTNVADGTTLEYSGSSIRIKDAGVATAKIADLAVSTAKLADDAVDSTKLKDDASVDGNRAVTTNHIRDSAVTLSKMAASSVDKSKVLTGHLGFFLFGDLRVAGIAAGNQPAILTEWTETNTSYIPKIDLWFLKRPGDKYLRVRAYARSGTAAKPWFVQATAGGAGASVTNTNTSYGVSLDVVIDLDISGQPDNTECEVQVWMKATSPATAYMQNLIVMVTPS